MNEEEIQEQLKSHMPKPILENRVHAPVLEESEPKVDLVMYPPWEQLRRVLVDGSLASFGFKPDKYDDLSEDEKDYMIDVLMEEGVLPNILEAPKYTFYISGISTIILAQITRARIGAGFISVTSGDFDQRPMGYVLPDAVRGTKWEQPFREQANRAYHLYGRMINDGIPLENARDITPRAHANYHIATFTYRAIQGLWNNRRCEASQPQPWAFILRQMKEQITEVHPPLGENLTWSCEDCRYPYVMPWNEDFNQFACPEPDAREEVQPGSGNFLYDDRDSREARGYPDASE